MTTSDDRERAARTAAMTWLIAVQILGVASLVPWMVGAAFTLVSIGDGIPLWVVAVWTYPAWVVGASGAAWRLFARRKYRAAAVVSILPLLPVTALFVLPALGSLFVG